MAFTQSTKRAIDYTVPSLAAFGAVWFFITQTKDRDVKFIAFVMILVFVITYALTSQTTKTILIATNKPKSSPLTGDTSVGINSTTGERTGFDVDGWVDRLKKDVYCPVLSICVRDEKMYSQMKLFGNDDLISMWNRWNDKYFGEHGETMTAAIMDEWFVIGSDVYANKETVINRLKSLGLK